MSQVRTAVWERDDEGKGHSYGRMAATGDGWVFHGCEVLLDESESLACWFRVRVDRDWLTREVSVRAVDADGERTVELTADDRRHWLVDGVRRVDLEGCLDVDVAATPVTNTLPIRRLAGLGVGDSVTTPVAWIEVPSLTVTRVDQAYRRLEPVEGRDAWGYSDPDHGAFTLTVDDDGMVVDYEGLARRIGPGFAALG
jgi:uncharacterized protein